MAALIRTSPRILSSLVQGRTVLPSLVRAFADFPADRKYKSSHEWAKLEGDVATIGITSHAQAALGDIVFADLPEIGTTASAGEKAATIESVKAAADIYAPITGEVVSVNDKLEETPDLINSEPHDNGWIFQVKVSDPAQLDELMDSVSYEKSLEDSK